MSARHHWDPAVAEVTAQYPFAALASSSGSSVPIALAVICDGEDPIDLAPEQVSRIKVATTCGLGVVIAAKNREPLRRVVRQLAGIATIAPWGTAR